MDALASWGRAASRDQILVMLQRPMPRHPAIQQVVCTSFVYQDEDTAGPSQTLALPRRDGNALIVG